MKFPTEEGVKTVYREQHDAKEMFAIEEVVPIPEPSTSEKSSIGEGHAEINSTSLTWDWRNKYINYLKSGKHPSDHKESRALRTKAARFALDEDGTLYRIKFDGTLVVCLGPGDTDYVLREIHKGTCGNHYGAESLVRKIIRAGYYWDIMKKYTKEFVRKCDKCQ
uniref:Integrase zinc-binding domain-containing protein n=1 Tax=Nicotiana tabacum TaxID=4097 RepID=A0A1S4CLS1_TOBAC|nr:PREDICTED: uncharacterized protein LOC107820171 [Nicotiana tabacum]